MEMQGIDSNYILKSLSLANNCKMVFRAGEGSGASGSFFFFSYDKRFLIKTLRGEEKKNLIAMLDSYTEHLR
jgi:hypothetical protein